MGGVSRVRKSKAEARASYDRLSKWYDVLVGRSEKKARDLGLAKLDAQEGESALEIGFGSGDCLLALARSVGDAGRVYGLDISEGMLKVTVGKLGKAGLSSRAELQLGDAANLPYREEFFDTVFMSFTLELFDTPEIPLVLQECRRVLKTGGRICVVAMSKQENPGLMTRVYEWGHERFPNWIDCRPIFVTKALETTPFRIAEVSKMSFWGIPAEAVLAEKQENGISGRNEVRNE